MNMFQQYPQARETEWQRRKRLMAEEDAMAMQQMHGQGSGQFVSQMQNPALNRDVGSVPQFGTGSTSSLASAPYKDAIMRNPAPQQGLLDDPPDETFVQQAMADEQALVAQQNQYEAPPPQTDEFSPAETQAIAGGLGQLGKTLLGSSKPKQQAAPKPLGIIRPNAGLLNSYKPMQMAPRKQIPMYNLLG